MVLKNVSKSIKLVYNPIVDNTQMIYQCLCQQATLKIHFKPKLLQKTGTHEQKYTV
jgi:hypothetical protein